MIVPQRMNVMNEDEWGDLACLYKACHDRWRLIYRYWVRFVDIVNVFPEFVLFLDDMQTSFSNNTSSEQNGTQLSVVPH